MRYTEGQVEDLINQNNLLLKVMINYEILISLYDALTIEGITEAFRNDVKERIEDAKANIESNKTHIKYG